MTKKFTLLSALFLTVMSVVAQVPMYFNTNAAGGQNSIPFNSGAQMVWRRAQFCMPANSLGVPAGNNITAVYFQAGSTANVTYPTFTVRLKTAAATGMQGVANGPFEAGMTQVFTATNFNMQTTTGNWYQIILQTPFLYDPNFPLIVDFEHDHSAAVGPTVMQPGIISLGGSNGRQWGNNSGAPISGVGTQQFNFGVDVLPATPCTVTPASNTILPSSYSTCPMIANPTLSLAATYSFGGITYQWQSSTVSPVGPFTAIPGATMTTAPPGTVGVTTWFNCVATCTNPGGGSNTITPTQFFVAGSVVSTVPYFEDFEGLQSNNRLPNCSWTAPSLLAGVNTHMSSQSGNRIARSGTKFGAFTAPTTNNHVYSNGITMQPGITYSAAIWYATEYFGHSNWTNLSLLVGPNQSPTGMVQIASTSPAISGPYKLLSGVFTVPTAGDYYIAIRANGASGSATYLSFDDLSVTIPCDGLGAVNAPTVFTSASSNTICQGDQLTINATGADAYLWDDMSANSSWNGMPMTNTVISVAGTNTTTGCTVISSQAITVNASPTVIVIASQPSVCPGQTSFLSALGAQSYAWNTGGITSMIGVSPSNNTTYSVVGTNSLGCGNTATVSVSVKAQPTVGILPTQESCAGEMVNVSANGAVSYTWLSSSNPIVLQGSNINVQLFTSTTFTAYGEGANGCTGISTLNHVVSPCTSIEKLNEGKQLNIYPNPSGGLFNLELSSGEISSVIITDLSGRTIMKVEGIDNKMQLDLSSLATGVYYATVAEGNTTHMVRLVKQ